MLQQWKDAVTTNTEKHYIFSDWTKTNQSYGSTACWLKPKVGLKLIS